MIVDRALFAAYLLMQRRKAGVRFQEVRDRAGIIWPTYHTRAQPASGIAGVPVVFFHGFGNDASTWFPLFALLGDSRELLAIDLPGFGKHGSGDHEPYTPAWYTKVSSDLVRELTARWGQPPILVGKSMGAMIAGLVAAEIPDLCRALVLIDPGGVVTPRESPFWTEYRQGRNLLLPRDAAEWETMVRTLYHRRRRIPGFIRRLALERINANRSRWETIFTQLLSQGMDPLGEKLSAITCPTTVIWGEQDQIIDVSGLERFRAELRDVNTVPIRECGHSPTSEAPQETRNELLRVFSRYG